MFRSFWILSTSLLIATWMCAPGEAIQVGAQNQTQQNGTQAAGGANQIPNAQAAMPTAGPQQSAPNRPFPPLSPKMQSYINKLLHYWENSSNQIKLYQCDFTRWQYDPVLCKWRNPENNHLAAKTISKGKIRFSDPDKGMYEVVQKWHFSGPPKKPGESPDYQIRGEEPEKWICDGKSIYDYDFLNKRMLELKLPPESQGEGLKNSPLPFVFGAKANELLERYWVRDVTPAEVQGQYWLEAWPKRKSDASAYLKVEIILSRKPFLPKSIHIYAPNYHETKHPAKMVFEFENRQINGNLARVLNFANFFVRPALPSGWERSVKKLVQDPSDAQVPQVGQLPNGRNSK